MKVAFFGTSNRSRPILDSLKNNFDLSLCVTKCDRPAGRNLQLRENGVKTWCKENSVPYFEIDSFKNGSDQQVLQKLKEFGIEYGVVADFSLIIPELVINFFGKKFVNIHFSLLPKYRGACPVQFAILNGDKITGITFLLVDKKLDAGEILTKIEYKPTGNETSDELYETLFKLTGQHLPEVLTKYEKGLLQNEPQVESEISYTYSPTHPTKTFIFKEDAFLNFENETAVSVYAKVRAYNSWPMAWTTLNQIDRAFNSPNKIFDYTDMVLKKPDLGKLTVKLVKVSPTKTGTLKINELVVENKGKMDGESFVNGYFVKL